jgi:Holliday junction resolvase RusA-like endonuclease
MSREKPDDKQKGMLKRMRRARGGRVLPRSGGGVHEDKKSKQVERQMADDADEEIRSWNSEDEIPQSLDAMTKEEREVWEEYKKIKSDVDNIFAKLKDELVKEKKDAAAD